MKVVAKNIEVIAYFTEEGKITPLKFRIKNENGEYQTIKIEKVVDTKLERLCGNNAKVFTCQSNIDGIVKIYEIKFIIESSNFILFKI